MTTRQLDRKTWRLVVVGYVVLSMAWLFSAGWIYKVTQDNKRALNHAAANQARIQKLTADTAGLICALAENDETGDKKIMQAYVSPQGGRFELAIAQLPPICLTARRVASERVGLTDP